MRQNPASNKRKTQLICNQFDTQLDSEYDVLKYDYIPRITPKSALFQIDKKNKISIWIPFSKLRCDKTTGWLYVHNKFISKAMEEAYTKKGVVFNQPG